MRSSIWTYLSEVKPQPVQWLWEGRVPLGKVTLLDGEPGVGKTTLALHLAARVSQGRPMPLTKTEREPADVLLFNADDNLADTVRPRLEAAGANLERIRAVDRQVSVSDLEGWQPALIVLDTLSAYLCLDHASPPSIVIRRLVQLARATGAAILAVQDLPDEESAPWAAEVLNAARVVLVVTALNNNQRRLAIKKTNLRSLTEDRPLVYRHDETHDVTILTGWADHT